MVNNEAFMCETLMGRGRLQLSRESLVGSLNFYFVHAFRYRNAYSVLMKVRTPDYRL